MDADGAAAVINQPDAEVSGRWLAIPRLLWRDRRGAVLALAGIVAGQVVAETAILVLLAGMIDRQLATDQSGEVASVTVPLIGIALLYLARFAVAPTAAAAAASLDWHVRAASGSRLLRTLSNVPLADLEDKETASAWARVQGVSLEAAFKPRAVSLFVEAILQRARLTALLLVVAWVAWVPALLLAAGSILYYLWARREVLTFLTGHLSGTDRFRRAGYYFELAVDRMAAKEVRLFGLGPWLVDRFRTHQQAGLDAIHQRRTPAWQMGLIGVVSAGVVGAAFGLTLMAASEGTISPGAMALLGAAILIGAATLISGEGWVWDLAAAPYARLLAMEARVARPSPGPGGTPGLLARAGDIDIDCLGFRYGSGAWVLRDLSLMIRRGQSLAIVGRNGAGKTTLVKLLCRLYRPNEGHIRVNGVDLAGIARESWVQQTAVLFQDFVRYPLTARDNIVVGRADDPSVLSSAIDQAGLREVVDRLDHGLETPLSRKYPAGTDLSGGQWQRLALARVLAAIRNGAQLLILDEPTASLDPEAEAEFNGRLLELAGGVTTIVVSHRFPTVRRADAIAVLDAGRVVELGSHDELMAAGGLYARLFRLQAARFTEASSGA